MLWLKILLVYCLVEGVIIWFGYRSREVWPAQDVGDPEPRG